VESNFNVVAQAGLIARAESVEPGFIGAIVYTAGSIDALLPDSEWLADTTEWSPDEPFMRARPISDESWLAMPETLTPERQFWLFEVVAGPDGDGLAYRGADIDPDSNSQTWLANLVAAPSSMLALRKRNRCTRSARHADCKPDTCKGRCRSYAVPDGADVLHLCACTPS
jgi:hypothetical protein